MTDTANPPPVLEPGRTCWRIARADRLAVIIDAAEYFAVVRDAIQNARHSVLMIGWDFDARTWLGRTPDGSEAPDRLGKFLTWVVHQRRDLRIHVLKWDVGALRTLGRGSTPLFVLDWLTSRRIRFRLDGAHPPSSAHHQKIIVIDDTLAFCGGIDMTANRWDTRAHLDDDPNRVRPTTRRRYGPWHDVSTAVTGEVARALGELARERWRQATGERLPAPPPAEDAWPARLDPTMRDVEVALSRTAPEYDGRPGVYEIEALYLAAIAAARRTIYIESQYFASRRIAEAMAARLREPDGPEIVVVNPETADGWLEEKVMGSARARLLDLVRKSDTGGRFRLFTPVTAGGQPIYVHAKVMIVDDWLLRVGSSNLNNRSLGFDTECDLSLETRPGNGGNPDLGRTILQLRHDLLAEHLGVRVEDVEDAVVRADGSLVAAIEALRSQGRTLAPFEPPEISCAEDAVLAENELLDPERPSSRRRAMLRWLRRHMPARLRRG